MLAFRELAVRIGDEPHKLFLQDGFYNTSEISDILHYHKYAEVHLTLGGDIRYTLGDTSFVATSGTMLVIPPGVFHAGVKLSEEALCTAFQTDAAVSEIASFSVGDALLGEMFREIGRAGESGDYSGIAAYASLLCRRFIPGEGTKAEPITDYGFLIHEFFSHRYAEDLTLADLAEALHLSERQTERLVYKHTGSSFRDELAKSRGVVAARLLFEGNMSLGEISAYVGYRSYAGFWKAMKKQKIL